MTAAPTFIDCFAGAGGLSLGLVQAGLRPRAAFDMDAASVATYTKNLGGHIIEADVRSLTAEQLLEVAGLNRGECDLLAGGPPCQGFSRQRRGSNEDERNDLVLDYLRLVEGTMPTWLLMENVAALAGPRGEAVLQQFTGGIARLGYASITTVLDAADFGVPQHRRRLIVLARRGTQTPVMPKPSHDADSWVTVRQAIGDMPCPFEEPERAALISNHERDNISEMNRLRLSHVPEGGGREDIPPELQLPCHRRTTVEKGGHRGVYGRLWWDRPSATMTTKCNSFTRGRFGHPALDRNITMREAARLQGFPDEFEFLGTKVPIAHQIGNAVPPPLARALGRAILGEQ